MLLIPCKGPAAHCFKKFKKKSRDKVDGKKSRFILNADILGGWRLLPKGRLPVPKSAGRLQRYIRRKTKGELVRQV